MTSFIGRTIPITVGASPGGRGRGGASHHPSSLQHHGALIVPASVIAVEAARSVAGLIQNIQDLTVTRDQRRHTTTITGNTPVAEEIVEIRSSRRPIFDVVLVLDVSGSMSGTPSREMLGAVRSVIGILEEADGLGIIKFSSDTETVVPLCVMKNMKVADQLAAHLESDGFRCGGRTKLWDSMAVALEALARRPRGSKHPTPSHPHLVVITDGEDVCSTAQSVESITSMLQQPGDFAKSLGKPGPTFANFHCSLISVGRPGDAHVQRFASMTDRPHLHHYTAGNAAEIKTCFREVQERILMIRRTQKVVSMEVRTVETLRPVGVAGRGRGAGRGGRGVGP